MTLTPQIFLIICPLLFLAGLVDAIGGGGGLISLPAYLLAGVPSIMPSPPTSSPPPAAPPSPPSGSSARAW